MTTVVKAPLLEHLVAGRWVTPDDAGHPLLDASTGEEVARYSDGAPDLGAMTS